MESPHVGDVTNGTLPIPAPALQAILSFFAYLESAFNS